MRIETLKLMLDCDKVFQKKSQENYKNNPTPENLRWLNYWDKEIKDTERRIKEKETY